MLCDELSFKGMNEDRRNGKERCEGRGHLLFTSRGGNRDALKLDNRHNKSMENGVIMVFIVDAYCNKCDIKISRTIDLERCQRLLSIVHIAGLLSGLWRTV